MEESVSNFLIVGLIASSSFQKCCFLAEKLHRYFPNKYSPPQIRPMLNLDWELYLTKMRRRFGNEFWLLDKPVAVFLNGEFVGDDAAISQFVSKRYLLETNVDFEEISNRALINYFSNAIEKQQRNFVYLTVAIDHKVVGSMLFLLYSDLVPVTCGNFLGRCKEREESYSGTKVHRIVKDSWIQCGGWDLKHRPMPCENYVVGHDKRGVLSMCNSKRHKDNSTQFVITLEPTSWMDYNYVAFGQLVQGAEILTKIEQVPTYYQSPLRTIEIVDSGEFTLFQEAETEFLKAFRSVGLKETFDEAEIVREQSVMSVAKYMTGGYAFRYDLVNFLPFSTVPFYLKYLEPDVKVGEGGRQEEEIDDNRKRVLRVLTTHSYCDLKEKETK